MVFSLKKLILNKPIERIEPMITVKVSLSNILTKFKALEEEANKFVEANAKKLGKLRAEVDVAEQDQKQGEAIRNNLRKFLGKE